MMRKPWMIPAYLLAVLLLASCNFPLGQLQAPSSSPTTTLEAAATEPTREPTPSAPTSETTIETLESQAISIGNVQDLTLQRRLQTDDEKSIRSLDLSNDGRYIAYTYWHDPQKAVHLFDLQEQVALAALTFHKRDVTTLVFSPDGELLAAGSQDGKVSLWSVDSWALNGSFDTIDHGVASLAFSPNGAMLALGGYKNKLALWWVTGELHRYLFDGAGPHVTERVTFTQDGSQVYADTDYADVTAWNTETGAKLQTFRGEACIGSFDLSSDETLLAYSSSCSAAQPPHDPLAVIAVREVATKDPVVFGQIAETSTILNYTPDDTLIMTNSDGTVRFWRASDGSLFHQLPKTARYVEFIVSDAGDMLILGEADGDILIYGLGS